MPSPFPGMDPYLEGDLWESFHGPLAYEIAREINRQVRPHYYALVTRRVMSDGPDEVVITAPGRLPDVSVLRESATAYHSGTATVEKPVKMTAPMPDQMAHYTVEIRDVAERELITAIEVLSPANKRGEGRLEYLKKRNGILRSCVNLIELDLLRQGTRVPMQDAYPDAPYFVLVHPFKTRPVADVWPIQLGDTLSSVPLPLRDEETLPLVALQDAFTAAYDGSSLDLAIDYAQPPPVSVPPDELAWIDERLRAQGKRT